MLCERAPGPYPAAGRASKRWPVGAVNLFVPLVRRAQRVHWALRNRIRHRYALALTLDVARDVVDVHLAAGRACAFLGDLPRAVSGREEHLVVRVALRRFDTV